jgi:hypothetical protein
MVITVHVFFTAFIRSIRTLIFGSSSISFLVNTNCPITVTPFASRAFFRIGRVSFAEPPQVAKITAFFPSHPLSAAIAPLIAGVALNAQTGVPMTSRSDAETSIVSGSIGSHCSFVAR